MQPRVEVIRDPTRDGVHKFVNHGYCSFQEFFDAAYIELCEILTREACMRSRTNHGCGVRARAFFWGTVLVNGEKIPFHHDVDFVGAHTCEFFKWTYAFYSGYVVDGINGAYNEFVKNKDNCSLFEIDRLEVHLRNLEVYRD